MFIFPLAFPILPVVTLPHERECRKPTVEPFVDRMAHASSKGFPTGYE